MGLTRIPYAGFRWEALLGLFLLAVTVGALFGMAAWCVRRRGGVAAALAWAGLVALVDFAWVKGFDFFGTAQMLTLPWAAAPKAVAFAALWGWASITFFVAGFAALGALLFEPGAHRRARRALIVWCLCFWLPGWFYRMSAETPQTLSAVAVGFWDMPMPEKMPARVKRWSADADSLPVRAGAGESASPDAAQKALRQAPQAPVFFVFPEFAFSEATNAASQKWLAELAGALPENAVAAAPWFDNAEKFNQCSLLTRAGERGLYRKTHLLRYIENYRHGAGNIVTAKLDDITVGVMICQDDNFTDVARGLSRAGAQVVGIPVMDWPGVNRIHPLSAVIRAIEGRFAVVRAAACGQSAIISATGETLARAEPEAVKAAGSVVIQACVHAGAARSLYARWGDAPLLISCALAVIANFARRRRRA